MVALLGRGLELAGMGVTLTCDAPDDLLTMSVSFAAFHALLAGALAAVLVALAAFLLYRLVANPRNGPTANGSR